MNASGYERAKKAEKQFRFLCFCCKNPYEATSRGFFISSLHIVYFSDTIIEGKLEIVISWYFTTFCGDLKCLKPLIK